MAAPQSPRASTWNGSGSKTASTLSQRCRRMKIPVMFMCAVLILELLVIFMVNSTADAFMHNFPDNMDAYVVLASLICFFLVRNGQKLNDDHDTMIPEKGKNKDLSYGYEFKRWAGQIQQSTCWRQGVTVCNRTIQLSLSNGEIDYAKELLSNMRKNGVAPDAETYHVFMHESARNGNFKELEAWLTSMTEDRIKPTETTYEIMIQSCSRLGTIQQVENMLGRMLLEGFVPSAASCTALVRMCAKLGASDHAEKWLMLMEEHGHPANTSHYTYMIRACIKSADIDRAEAWAKRLLASDCQLVVEASVAMLRVCAKTRCLSKAESWFHKFSQAGVTPTVKPIVTVCIKTGELVAAKDWLMLGECSGRAPDARLYCLLLRNCVKGGLIVLAGQILDHMETIRVRADLVSFNALLNAYAKVGQMRNVGKTIECMDRVGIIADVVTCNIVLEGFAIVKDSVRARKLFDRMHAKGLNRTAVTYTALAKCHAVNGEWFQVEELAEEMAEEGIMINDYFLYQMLSAYGRSRQWVPTQAEAAFRRAIASGVQINGQIVKALSRALGMVRCEVLLAELCGNQRCF